MLSESILISKLVALVGCDEELAKTYLVRARWRLWAAVELIESDIGDGLLTPFPNKIEYKHADTETD